MSIKATVNTQGVTRVSINTPNRQEVRTVGIGSAAAVQASQLRNLTDVDATSLGEGKTIVYNATSDKFVVSEIGIINGGTF